MKGVSKGGGGRGDYFIADLLLVCLSCSSFLVVPLTAAGFGGVSSHEGETLLDVGGGIPNESSTECGFLSVGLEH